MGCVRMVSTLPYGETRYTTGSLFTDRLYTGQQQLAGLGPGNCFPGMI
jgi:hypothetical protein